MSGLRLICALDEVRVRFGDNQCIHGENPGFEVELQVETLGEERLQHQADLLLLLIGG